MANLAYQLTKQFQKDELFGLTNQIEDLLFPSFYIAEGCGRKSSKDTLHFLHISRGSLYEIETQLYIALDQNYIEKEDFEEIINKNNTL